MLLVLPVAALALLVVAVLGRWHELAHAHIRAVRLLVAAAVVQLLVAGLMPTSAAARTLALLLGGVLVGLFLAGNARLPGVPLIALGLFLNAVVIVLNAGMPVSLDAARRAGLTHGDLRLADDPMREVAGPGTRLGFLGDTVPVALPWRPQVVSPGDVLVAAGVGLLLVTASGRSARRRPSQATKRADRSTVLASDSTTRGSYS